MKSYVLDTSALLRLYIPDGPLPEGVEEALELAWRAEAIVFVPELALVECAQVLLKKARARFITEAEADEILDSILELPLEIVGHRELLRDALEAARRHQLTAHDALSLALAADRHGTLLSADERLVSACQRDAE
ncbi:MAG: hypothetical protein A2289_17315 [Deltaproteobacteria bacterium RIFOXYA12_FULL_58_15]|nr:MAG: hypothetical protein A2289_17315 [Deltaproteobacteria bacterium RIFOXYA12_FULL_58_15]OGR09014.1 MAG: hypothetical protein A2341_26090 [Deltaproteobacteria bacterium RIFOXYB12_FULL_58_9]